MSDFCQDFVNEPVHLQTLVRLSGPAIDCPFTGKFTFTYKTGKKILKFKDIPKSVDKRVDLGWISSENKAFYFRFVSKTSKAKTGIVLILKSFSQGSKFKTNQYFKIRLQIFDMWCKNVRQMC